MATVRECDRGRSASNVRLSDDVDAHQQHGSTAIAAGEDSALKLFHRHRGREENTEALTRRFAAPSPRGRGWPEGPGEGFCVSFSASVSFWWKSYAGLTCSISTR